MKKVLLTDVDGVILDWVKSFGQFAQSKGYKLLMETPSTWEMNEWIGTNSNTIKKLISEFNSSDLFESIPVFEDAKSILPKLAKKYDLVAVTCCSKDPKTVSRRTKNLQKIGVNFKAIHCLDFTESKLDVLRAYSPTIWIEDRVEGAETGFEAGHQSFLRNTTYNKDYFHPKITRINNWLDVLNSCKSNIDP